MKELQVINNVSLSVKEWDGKRVVTFKDIDAVHNRSDGTARRNFNTNRERFILGEDYFKICADEFRTRWDGLTAKATEDVTLITESGYLMLVKSFTDDLAWKVQRELVNGYFRAKQSQRPNTAAEQLLAQAQLMVEQEKRLSAVETRQTELAERCGENGRKLDTLTAVIVEPYASEQDWQERIGRTIRAAVAQYGLNYRRFYAELYDELERTAGVSLKSRQTRLKKRMLAAGSTKSQCSAVTKLYVISMDKKLRPLMESILRRRILEYAAAKPIR